MNRTLALAVTSWTAACSCAIAAPQHGPARDTAFTRRDVAFDSHGAKLAGHLYLPPAPRPDAAERLPGLVVTGAWTTVKEQMPSTYAAQLAKRGYAVLAFDFRGWGASEGTPRFVEHPERKTQDIVAAAAFLASVPEVDAGRIGGVGICASAGYMSDAARRSSNLRAIALVAPWLHDAAIAESVYGGREAVEGLIARGRDAVAADEPVIIEAASTTNESSLMYRAPYYTETDRGLIEPYDNKFAVASWEPWLTYDAIRVADTLRKPLLAVHSEAAVVPNGIREFARRMGPSGRVVWLDDISQFDFYDRTDAVAQAADLVVDHFSRAFAHQQDVAAVSSVLEGVAVLVDLRRFEALESLYAEKVVVDYRSLDGQPAATLTARELISRWAALLPGFDRTRHVLSELFVTVDGDRAVATADVVADHFVGNAFWQARGRYRFELTKSAGAWRIASHALEMQGESGTRDVFAIASERAAQDPAPYLRR